MPYSNDNFDSNILKISLKDFIPDNNTKEAYMDINNSLAIKDGKSFFLCGNPGTGKTMLGAGVFNYFREHKTLCEYMTGLEILLEIKSNYDQSFDMIQYYGREINLLVIDELEKIWKTKDSNNDINILFDILNKRGQNEKGRTILISNMSMQETLGFFQPSMVDRFTNEWGLYEFTGESKRGVK